MRILFVLLGLFAVSFFQSKSATAQVHINVNIGVQPAWGPVGYDYAEYYYLPGIEVYYSIPLRQFVYFDRGVWIHAVSLPARCRSYDLYSGYKVVLNEGSPWRHFSNHRVVYSPYKYKHGQVVLRDHRGGNNGNAYGHDRGHGHGRYEDNDDHYREKEWASDRDHDNGRGHGHGKKDR